MEELQVGDGIASLYHDLRLLSRMNPPCCYFTLNWILHRSLLKELVVYVEVTTLRYYMPPSLTPDLNN
jgi:hypothetical protein